MLAWIQQIDWTILHWIQGTLHNNVLDFLMPAITTLGNNGAIWLIAAAAITISKKYRAYGIALFAVLAIGIVVNNLYLKPLIARPRPCWIESVPMLIAIPKDYSFPSGHTVSSIISAYMLTVANRQFGYVAIPLAALISFSRLYLYVHFPSDILASITLGILFGAITTWVLKKYEFHRNKQSE